MGIRATFSGDATAIDLSRMADDMLAQVIADYAAERFRVANRANAKVAGGDITYTVTVDGKTVHRGKGDLFPTNAVSTILRSGPPARRRHSITVDWLWNQLQGVTLARAITAIGQIDDAVTFARVLMNPRSEAEALLQFLWRIYLQRYVSPARARFISKLWERSQYARAAFRLYRQLHFARSVVSGPAADHLDVLVWIARELRERSPVLTGAYRDAHALYGDGEELMNAADVSADADIPDAEEYSFTNPLPYARKIEIGVTQSGRDFVVNASPRIYERVADEAAALFRDVADVSFEWRAEIGGVQTPQREARRVHNQPDVRYPAIVVRFS